MHEPFLDTPTPSVKRQPPRSLRNEKIKMASTRPLNDYQTHLVQTTRYRRTPRVEDTFALPRYSVDVHGLGYKLLSIRQANPLNQELIVHVRIMWYDCSVTNTSFVMPSDTHRLILIGLLSDGQMYSFREYLVSQYTQ